MPSAVRAMRAYASSPFTSSPKRRVALRGFSAEQKQSLRAAIRLHLVRRFASAESAFLPRRSSLGIFQEVAERGALHTSDPVSLPQPPRRGLLAEPALPAAGALRRAARRADRGGVRGVRGVGAGRGGGERLPGGRVSLHLRHHHPHRVRAACASRVNYVNHISNANHVNHVTSTDVATVAAVVGGDARGRGPAPHAVRGAQPEQPAAVPADDGREAGAPSPCRALSREFPVSYPCLYRACFLNKHATSSRQSAPGSRPSSARAAGSCAASPTPSPPRPCRRWSRAGAGPPPC